MFKFSLFSDRGHDYLPLTHHSKRRSVFFWLPIGLLALLILNMLALWQMRIPLGPLDKYQNINPSSPVHEPYDGPPAVGERAVVTTLYSESFVTAVLTLGQSLKETNVTARMVVMYLPQRISSRSRCQLHSVGWELRPIDRVPPPNAGKGVARRFLDQYTKLHIWSLDQIGIKTVIYIDGDTVVRRNFDELWSLPFNFGAVPDVQEDNRGFTLSFNAGVMFLRTSTGIFEDMLSKIGTARYTRKDAEQGFLNLYFGAQAIRLPYIYNANVAIKRKSPAVWDSLAQDIRIVHYTVAKPFLFEKEYNRLSDTRQYDEETRAALNRKKHMDNGLWRDEMTLWETSWERMNAELEGRCS